MIFSIRNVVLKSISFALLFLTLSSAYAGLFESRHLQGEVGASGVIYTDKKGESLPIWVKSRWQDDKRVEVAVFPNIQQSLENPAYTEQAIVVKRYIDIFNHWKTQNPDLATTGRFLLRKDISNTTFALVNKNMDAAVAGDVVLNAISPNTKLIFARGQSQTTQPTPEHIVLLEFPVTIVATLNEEPRQGEINANPNGYKILVQGENDISYLYGSDGILEEDGIATFSASKNGKVLSLADIATLDPTDKANQTVFTAIESFSYRTAYFKKDGLNLESETAINIADRRYYYGNASEPLLFPVKQAPISIAGNQEGAIYGGWDLTNDQGRFSVNYIIPYCFGVFDVPTPIQTQLNYASFNPNGSNNLNYTLTYPHRTTCLRSFSVAPHPLSPPIVAVNEHADDAYDFIMINVDFNVFTGKASFTNKNITSTSSSSTVVSADTDTKRIKIEDTTIYTATAPKVQDINTLTIPDYFDFNGDGKADTIKPGRLKTLKIITGIDADGSSILEDKTVFVVHTDSTNPNPNPNPNTNTDTTATIDNPIYYGVYISDNKTTYTLDNGDTSDAQPDFIRLADTALNTAANGLLTQISKSAARNTDVMIFRESTGELLLHFHGLDNGVDATGALGLGVDADTETLGYTARIRGGLDKKGESTTEQYSNAVKKQRINTSLYKRTGNHLRPGERVQIILKNRSTGYMGMATKTIQSFGTLAQQQADDIELKPPQLKIWAQRLTANEATTTLGNLTSEKNYLIGHEGAGLDSDEQIILYTEWLGPEGQPLPAGLSSNEGKDFGYTGFLTRINNGGKLEDATNNAEDLSGSTATQFAIRPGLQMQLIRLSNDIKNNQHFYVYVSGKAMVEEHCTPGSEQELASLCYDVKQTHGMDNEDGNTNILQGRPLYYTPLLTPRYDEEGYWQDLKAFRDGRTSIDNTTELVKPKASYAWGYRPEYQFSLLSLQMDQIKRTYTDANDADQTVTLFDINANNNTKNPTLSSSNSLLEILYSLSDDAENSSPLPSLDLPMGQELVFALGEHEIHATAGANQTIKFDSLEHLGLLEVEDFLSVRLYLNHDAANVLWEYAFTPTSGTVAQYISADNPQLDLLASQIVDFEKYPDAKVKIKWSVEGGNSGQKASFIQEWTDSSIGIYRNTLKTSNQAGNIYYVSTEVVNSNVDNVVVGSKSIFGPYIVVAGIPDSVTYTHEISPLVSNGVETKTIKATIKDAQGNNVEDGTPIDWDIGYSGDLSNQDIETTDGKVSALYTTGVETLSTDITITSGNAEGVTNVIKTPFDFDMTVSTASVEAGSTQGVTVTITTAQEPTDPLNITWNTAFGDLYGSTTLSGTTVTAVFYPKAQAGSGQITAVIGGVEKSLAILVTGVSEDAVVFDVPALVNATAGEMAIVDTLDGGTNQHEVVISTTATAFGTPNTDVTLEVGGFFTPNAVPSFHMDMTEILSRQIDDNQERYISDRVAGADGVLGTDSTIGITYDESYTANGSSLEFTDGSIIIRDKPALDITSNLFANIRFNTKVAQAQTLFNKGSSSYKMELVEDADTGEIFVKATVLTTSGTYSVTSSKSININQWYIAGIQVKGGKLQLRVDSTVNTISVVGNIVHGGFSNNLVIGGNFQGYMDDIKIGEIRAAALLLSLGNDQQSQTLTFDDQGKAVFIVKSNGVALSQAVMQKVGFTLTRAEDLGADNTPIVRDVRVAQQVINRLTGMSLVRYVHAQEVGDQAVHEDGPAVVDKELFGWATEAALYGAFGTAYEHTKTALIFVYEISGLSDIGTIVKLIMQLSTNKKYETKDAIDAGFAVIGLSLTVFTIMSGGGGAILKATLKKPLDTLKLLLKELFINPADVLALVKAGGTMIRKTMSLLNGLRKGEAAAKEAVENLIEGFKVASSDATGKTLKFLVAMGRSEVGLQRFIDLVRVSRKTVPNCVAAIGINNDFMIADRLQERLFLSSFVMSSVQASPACPLKLLDNIADIGADAVKYGDDAMKVASDVAGQIVRLSDAGIHISDDSIDILEKLVAKGHGEKLTAFFDKVIEGKVTYTSTSHTMPKFSDYPLSGPTVKIDKKTDSITNVDADGVLIGDTLTDYFLGSLDEILKHADDVEPEFLLESLAQVAKGGVDMRKIKGMFGELESLKTIKNIEEYDGATLKTVNNRALSIKGKDVQGIDAEYVLKDGRSMYVESKNIHATNVPAITKQFRKHIREAISKNHYETVIISPRKTDVKWKGDQVPRLHYELRGSFFNAASGTDKAGMSKVLKDEIKNSSEQDMMILRKLLEKDSEGFDKAFDKFMRIEEYPDLIPPFST